MAYYERRDASTGDILSRHQDLYRLAERDARMRRQAARHGRPYDVVVTGPNRRELTEHEQQELERWARDFAISARAA